MDFDLAPPIQRALHCAVDAGDTGYTSPAELRDAFVRFWNSRFSAAVAPHQVFVVPDVMAGVQEALNLFTRPGDAVVVNPPVYAPFFQVIRNAGRVVAQASLTCDDTLRWSFDLHALEGAFASGARAFLLCSPHNPVGRVWRREELRAVAELARAYDVAVIADEIHAPLLMPGVEFVSYLSIADEEQSALALTSATKAWNIAGLKCGIMVASASVAHSVRDHLSPRADEVLYRTGHFGVLASIAAFRDGQEWLDALRAYLAESRNYLHALLNERLPAIRYRPQEATYLAWLDCRGLALGDDPAAELLQRGRVALEPGKKFGAPGVGFVRLNMGTSRNILHEIVQRMAHALN